MLVEPQKPYPPSPFDYGKEIKKKYIYSYTLSMFEGEQIDEDDEAFGSEIPNSAKAIERVNLAWLLTQIPEGITPDQIKIDFGYNSNCMAFEDCYVRFYYEEKIPARKKEYNVAKAKYEEEMLQFVKDLAAYNAAKLAQEIKETEARLAKLKSGK